MNTSPIRVGLLATAALLFTVAAEAAVPPPVQVSIDGIPVGVVSWAPDFVPGAFVTAQTPLVPGIVNIGESLLEPTSNPSGTGWSFSYGLGFNVPASAVASTLRVEYGIPVGPYLLSPSQPVEVTSTLVGTLLDGNGGGAQIIAPGSIPFFNFVQLVTAQPGFGDNILVSVGPSAFAGPSGISGQQYTYGPFSATNSLTAGNLNFITVVAEFTLQPGISALALDGTVVLTPVPEPEGWAMILAGLGLVGTMVRRRSRA